MASIKSRLALLIVIVGLVAGMPGMTRIYAQPPAPLDGSLSGTLALRRVDPADVTRQGGQLLLLTAQDALGDDLAPVMANDQGLHVLGWIDGGLLVLLAADDGQYAAAIYDPAVASETILATDLPANLRYAFVPATESTPARVVGWQTGPQSALAAVEVWAAADFQSLATYDVSAAGLMAARLAGVVDDRAYFYSAQPTDVMLALTLTTGAVDGPVEVLATGEDAGQVLTASAAAGQPLTLAGRINLKDTPAVFTIPVETGVLNAGTAQTFPVPDAAQRIVWRPDGAGAAVVTAVPGNFSGSNVLLTGPDFGSFGSPLRAAFDGCVTFTPDSRWLLFVSPDGTSLLAASVVDPNASTRVLLRGASALDLCEAAWLSVAPEPEIATPVVTEMRPGSVITGEITNEAYAVDVPLPLTEGDTVTITMEATGGDLDAFLLLFGPDDAELARNDDAPQQVGDSATNAQILNFTAPVTGTYIVRATRFFEASGITDGTFRLSVVTGEQGAVVVLPPTPVPTPAPEVTEEVVATVETMLAVQVGDSVTGTLDDAIPVVSYTIDLQPGEAITVTLERLNGDLDPYLTVIAPDGREVAFNDDAEVPVGGIPFNAQLRGFSGDVAGTYTIQATRYGGEAGMSSGDYTLTIAAAQAIMAEGTSLLVGDTVEGTITDAQPIQEYTIALDAGQTITVTLEALDSELDPYLLLLDSSGQEIAFNDDAATPVGASTYNAQLAGWTAPATDVYTIRATRFLQASGPTTGPFRLSVTGSTPAALPGEFGIVTGPDVALGDVVTGEITADVYAVDYPILLEEGATIAVTMEALGGDLDTLILIYDPEGSMASYNDDAVDQVGSDPYNSRITGFTAPSGGLYTIEATRLGLDEGTTTGPFELRVEAGQPVSASDGGQLALGDSATGSLTTTVFAVDFSITLTAGEPVTITMIALEARLDPALVLYDAAGNELAYNDDAETEVGDSAYNAQIVGFTPRTTGTYTIRATRFLEEGGPSVGRFRLETVAGTGDGPAQSNK